MTLHEIALIFLRRFVFIIILTIVFMISSALISSLFIVPKYESSAQMIVNKTQSDSNTSDVSYNDILLTQKLVNTYSVIINSDSVLNKVIQNLKLNITPEELRKNLTILGVNDTEIIKISVVDSIPERAADIANELTHVSPDEIIRTVKAGSVELIDRATISDKPISPDIPMIIIIAGLVGFLLALMISIVIEKLDRTIKTEEDVNNILKLPVLGSLPKAR
ncbi:MAG: Wzz/FepE/Etk N-terminal domain-containing protein [Nanoarchaeota archaeon]|nr:Wzz/FepE/Etk N-terminal domain-containing protein [Nanoarchaeota archaeon]